MFRFGVFALGQHHSQNPVLELRVDLVCVNEAWQCEAAGELAVIALDAMIVLLLGLFREPSLAVNRQYVVFNRDAHVFALHLWQFNLDYDLIVALVDVTGRRPGAERPVLAAERLEWIEAFKEPLRESAERIEAHHFTKAP